MEEPRPIQTKLLIPVIPTDDKELRELKEDLRAMGCVGLLARPWNFQVEDTLREFLYERGNKFKGLGGENQTVGLRIHGLGFTDLTGMLKEDGQDARTGCLPESSTER